MKRAVQLGLLGLAALAVYKLYQAHKNRKYRFPVPPRQNPIRALTHYAEPLGPEPKPVEDEDEQISRVIALIPAHNEQDNIGVAVESVCGQVDQTIVISDNSTDDTIAVAYEAGADVVYMSVDNEAKKAGALNQVLAEILPSLNPNDFVLVQDADSVLDDGFINGALEKFASNPDLGGVSGTFRGQEGGGFVGAMQRNEYARYARDVRRLKGKALVLTGTAAMFRVEALEDIIEWRESGQVYDERVLTEDNELTLALLHRKWKILAPRECTLTTEVMETWGDLAKQRLRWKRGAFENLGDYGLTRITASYWGRQALSLISIIATTLYLATVVWALTLGSFHVQPFWLAVTGVFMIERVVTLRDRGWKHQLYAWLLIVELPFDIFLQGVQAKAFAQVALRREAKW